MQSIRKRHAPRSPEIARVRSRIGSLAHYHPDSPELPHLRAQLVTLVLEDEIQRAVAEHDIPAEARHRLASLLLAGGAR